MVTADLPIRIAIIDQVVYFIKELMLDTPAEHYLPQFMQLLLSLVKIWHYNEVNKVQL